jgi:tetratricopeptide (TPR) repeat protein
VGLLRPRHVWTVAEDELYVSSGRWDDYLEPALPEERDCYAAIAGSLSALAERHAPVDLDVRLRSHPSPILCVLADYGSAETQRERPFAERVRDLLGLLAEAVPALDLGDLLPRRPPALAAVAPVAEVIGTKEVLPQAPAVTPPVTDERALELARRLAAKGQVHKALRAVEDQLRVTPGLAEAVMLREELRALERREKRRRLEPRNAQALLEAGFSYLAVGATTTAVEALGQATRLEPDLYLAQLLLGVAMHKEGQPVAARAAYTRAAALNPGEGVVGDLLATLGRGEPPPRLAETATLGHPPCSVRKHGPVEGVRPFWIPAHLTIGAVPATR